MTHEKAINEASRIARTHVDRYIASFVAEHVTECACGEWFVALSATAKYCSPTCSHKYRRESQRDHMRKVRAKGRIHVA